MSTTTITRCDVCKAEMATSKGQTSMQVIFTTEQTEGRPTEPYFSTQQLDICGGCKATALQGNYLFAHGAMGCNTYYFKINKEQP